MKMYVLTPEQHHRVYACLTRNVNLLDAFAKIREASGTAYLVGGAVRDLMLEKDFLDIDIEVHGLSLECLATILGQFGVINFVGKSFGVLRWEHSSIDWVLPRHDNVGRKPEVLLDPSMDITQALRRRDVTMNAMAINVHTGEFIDPFNGRLDLEQKIMRSPDTAFFSEDPLRLYRVMQFVGRFEMQPDEALQAACKKVIVTALSKERIEEEFRKLFLLSQRPSLGIRFLDSVEQLESCIPELHALKGVQQNPVYHPEGDAFEHSLQACDAAARFSYTSSDEKIMIVMAALLHDIGKKTTTTMVNGRLISYGHETVGATLAQKRLSMFMTRQQLRADITTLIRFHMMPGQLIQQRSSSAAYRRLASRLGHLSLLQLAHLAAADKLARNQKKDEPLQGDLDVMQPFIDAAHKAGVLYAAEKPVIEGKDLIGFVAPGSEIGRLIKQAYELQINKNCKNKEELLARILPAKKRN